MDVSIGMGRSVDARTNGIWPGRGGVEDEGYWRFFRALLDGRLRLGEVVTQERLCAVLGMSLSPLRETVTLLSAEGLVAVRRRVGVTIFTPDVAFIRSSFQFRGLIEREGLRKLAEAPPAGWAEEMRRKHERVIGAVREAATATDYEGAVKDVEQDLHGAFVGAFDNPIIEDTHARLFRRLYLLRLLYPASVNTRATVRAMEEHLDILRAIEEQRPELASEQLDRHLGAVLHRMLGI